ncbi:MAG: DUF881 domain-containing protein [Clostridia bacterium]|jgi:uncharacterized protein YlxW (UPF0749 family)|nr:DUF881 domain-containing protein [Clostridiales bacterium]
MDRLYKSGVMFLGALLLGLTFTVQFTASREGVGIVTPETVPQLENELHNTRAEIEGLQHQYGDLRSRLREYEKAVNQQGDLNEILQQQLEQVKMLAGLTAVTGPGIEIVLDDSSWEMTSNNDPNLLLVHDEDILTVVSELKAAGAEAIAINGQRIMFNTEIRCGGPTININSVRYAPPYTITAIGEPNTLYGYMSGRESGYLDLLEYYGLQVSVEQKEELVVPAYTGRTSFKYVKTQKEGE